MNKTEICTSLIKIANKLDRDGETQLADELTVLASSIADKNVKEAINFRKMFKGIGRGLTNVAKNPMFQAWAAQQLLKGKTPQQTAPGQAPQLSPQQALQQQALQLIKRTTPTTQPVQAAPVAAPRSGNIPSEFLIQPGTPTVAPLAVRAPAQSTSNLDTQPVQLTTNLATQPRQQVKPAQLDK